MPVVVIPVDEWEYGRGIGQGRRRRDDGSPACVLGWVEDQLGEFGVMATLGYAKCIANANDARLVPLDCRMAEVAGFASECGISLVFAERPKKGPLSRMRAVFGGK